MLSFAHPAGPAGALVSHFADGGTLGPRRAGVELLGDLGGRGEELGDFFGSKYIFQKCQLVKDQCILTNPKKDYESTHYYYT